MEEEFCCFEIFEVSNEERTEGPFSQLFFLVTISSYLFRLSLAFFSRMSFNFRI